MSGIYKKIITTTVERDYIKCDKCEHETPFVSAIDTWIIHEGDNYCLSCQREHDLGFYKKKK